MAGPPRATGLVDSGGRPIPAHAVDRARSSGMRASLQGGGNGWGGPYGSSAFAYDAAAVGTAEMGEWFPTVRSPDSEINPYRDRMVARQRDIVRNDGFATGLVGRILDATIGAYYRLISKPDYRALAARFGGVFDAVWASEFRSAVEARWRTYAEEPGHYNDVSRQLTKTQQYRLLLGHKLVDGEALSVRYWLPDRVGRGAARYASSLLVVDPDRLSNPMQQLDTTFMRSGVEIDRYGVPNAYHLRKAHQNDWYNAVESMQWDRVVREDDDGFVRVIHDFDRIRAGQNRGVSLFAPVISRMKMLAKYYGLKLQAENVATAFGFVVTSPYDKQMIEEALDGGEDEDRLGLYAGMREGFHIRNALSIGDVKPLLLAPGEEASTIASARPPGEMTPFAHEMLRSVGAALGVSGETVTGDFSETNFSSMRVGITNDEKTFKRLMANFNANTASQDFAGWLHEAMDLGEFDDVLPRDAPDFLEARAEYARGRWLGAARGWYDPVAERQGAVLGLDAGFDTLEDVAAEQGADWEENVDQRAIEFQRFKDRGLPPAEWMGAIPAEKAATKPEPA